MGTLCFIILIIVIYLVGVIIACLLGAIMNDFFIRIDDDYDYVYLEEALFSWLAVVVFISFLVIRIFSSLLPNLNGKIFLTFKRKKRN